MRRTCAGYDAAAMSTVTMASGAADANARAAAFVRRLALLCALLVLAVGALSAFLRLDKAGLGCADWPACYGQAQRAEARGDPPAAPSVGSAIARVAHRASASLALLLVITMVLACHGVRPVLRREGRHAVALLVLALGLALLGIWSRDARLPAVAIGNLLGGFLMLALCVRLALRDRPADARLRRWAALAGGVLLLQIALGAHVSASYAGLSCSGAADCSLGTTWTAAGAPALAPWREPVLLEHAPFNAAGAFTLALHRHAALPVAALLLAVVLLALRRGRRGTGIALLALLVLQAALGLALGAHALPLPVALAHNLVATALLSTLATLL
jgi:cytochrome c oxidase assembly protein subunit 15